MATGRRYSSRGRIPTSVYVPGDPSPVDLDPHRLELGHRADTSARDEAPLGGSWVPLEVVQSPAAGLRSPVSEPTEDFSRSHGRTAGHREKIPGGDDVRVGPLLAFIRGYFPKKPNIPATLDTAGAAGAAHGGLGERGMDPSSALGRKCADGRVRNPPTPLGHQYFHPIERVRRPLHFNRPRIRPVLRPGITIDRGGKSPGGYSSQYDPTIIQRTAGVRNPILRRLIKPAGQADVDEVSQSPGEVARRNPGPIGNGGW